MASNYTSNYRLNQWAASDKVLRTEFNADNAKIETALAGLESSKAAASALNSLKTTVNGKADKSALTTLQSTVTAHTTALERRNCRIVLGSYSGTGRFGESYPNTIKFNTKPTLLFVTSSAYFGWLWAVSPQATVWHYCSGDQVTQTFTWGDDFVSWYNVPNLSAASARKQLNEFSTLYYYAAVLVP